MVDCLICLALGFVCVLRNFSMHVYLNSVISQLLTYTTHVHTHMHLTHTHHTTHHKYTTSYPHLMHHIHTTHTYQRCTAHTYTHINHTHTYSPHTHHTTNTHTTSPPHTTHHTHTYHTQTHPSPLPSVSLPLVPHGLCHQRRVPIPGWTEPHTPAPQALYSGSFQALLAPSLEPCTAFSCSCPTCSRTEPSAALSLDILVLSSPGISSFLRMCLFCDEVFLLEACTRWCGRREDGLSERESHHESVRLDEI